MNCEESLPLKPNLLDPHFITLGTLKYTKCEVDDQIFGSLIAFRCESKFSNFLSTQISFWHYFHAFFIDGAAFVAFMWSYCMALLSVKITWKKSKIWWFKGFFKDNEHLFPFLHMHPERVLAFFGYFSSYLSFMSFLSSLNWLSFLSFFGL